MSGLNNSDTLEFCAYILNKILDFQISKKSGETVFAATIEELRQIAAAYIYGRKKKNYGVIGGSSAAVAGGVITMLGGALIPFTFGTSTLLIVSGVAIGVAGTGASYGFSVEKSNDDSKSRKKLEPMLNEFINFNKYIAKSTVTIQALLEFISTKNKEKQTSIELSEDRKLRIQNIETEARKLEQDGLSDTKIDEKIKLINDCVGNVQNEMIELFKHMFSYKVVDAFVQKTEKKCENAFDHLEESIPKPKNGKNNKITFRDFVRQYLAVDVSNPDNKGKDNPIGKAKEAAAKTVAGGGAVAARTALRVVDVTDNIAKVGGTVAKVAKGVSVASVMLSTVGIIVDIAFLGHAIYDLLQVSEIENRQGAKTKNAVKIEPNDFTDLLLELADIMQRINEVLCWEKTQ